jgi:predicted Rossmann-fold nucleotide-binding protein
MWTGLLDWMKKSMLPSSLVYDRDLEIIQVVESIEDAVRIIKEAKEKFDASTSMIYAAGSNE